MITVTYFQPDKKKDGGSYVTVSGRLKSIFLHARMLLLYDGTEISLDEIIDLDSPLLSSDI